MSDEKLLSCDSDFIIPSYKDMCLTDEIMFREIADAYTDQFSFNILREMVRFAEEYKEDVLALSANMLGIPHRVAIVKDEDGKFICGVNPYLYTTEGEAYETSEVSLVFPRKYVKVNRFPKIGVCCEAVVDIESPDSWDYKYVSKSYNSDTHMKQCMAWQHVIDALNGVEWEVVRKDWRTFRSTEHKVSRNDPCTCGSGKKFKKCCSDKTPLVTATLP